MQNKSRIQILRIGFLLAIYALTIPVLGIVRTIGYCYRGSSDCLSLPHEVLYDPEERK